MANYIPDILSRRWVILSPQRLGRPEDGGEGKKSVCPFCPGNEHETPPEIVRFGGGEPNKIGWKLRVIPNKFPITDIHEVIIHSPDCTKDIEQFETTQVEFLFKAYRDRFNVYRKEGKVMIFCNHGLHAGASLTHPHSQLVVIPQQIRLDALSREPIANIVVDNTYFVAYCPTFSQWPYELWIAPKREKAVFGDTTDEELKDLSELVQRMLKKLSHVYAKHHISNMAFGYNYYIYYKEDWYLRIIPRFIHRAGFELGTGLSVNIIDPKDAAKEFKKL